jgi:hypothetical protein
LDGFNALVAQCSLSAEAAFIGNDRDKAVEMIFIATGTWIL